MPEISLFYGIRVTMYYDDHNPPHFHAEYNGNKAPEHHERPVGALRRNKRGFTFKAIEIDFGVVCFASG